jgi:hypothetical protein
MVKESVNSMPNNDEYSKNTTNIFYLKDFIPLRLRNLPPTNNCPWNPTQFDDPSSELQIKLETDSSKTYSKLHVEKIRQLFERYNTKPSV